jgi:hypothetical protein
MDVPKEWPRHFGLFKWQTRLLDTTTSASLPPPFDKLRVGGISDQVTMSLDHQHCSDLDEALARIVAGDGFSGPGSDAAFLDSALPMAQKMKLFDQQHAPGCRVGSGNETIKVYTGLVFACFPRHPICSRRLLFVHKHYDFATKKIKHAQLYLTDRR